jgi:outer membrane protein OmpA-like peptidoglycan-associated protein
MKSTYLAAAAILVSCSASEAATLTIQLGGSAYNGGPAFAAYMGSVELGRGTTSDPIPAGGQTFSFEIEDSVLDQNVPLEIRFTNDVSDTGGDRNLVVLGASIGTMVFNPEAMEILRSGEISGRNNGFLSKNEDVARIDPPDSGWAGERRTDSIASAEAHKPLVTDSECPSPTKVSFPVGLQEITAANLVALNAAISTASATECSVQITGYSSSDGLADVNLRLSTERARSVAEYIRESGPQIGVREVTGLGATDDFGSPSENRVVVVSFE